MKRKSDNQPKLPKSRRPLFIVLGAVVVLLFVVAFGLYISYSPEHAMNSAVVDKKLVAGGTVLYKNSAPTPFDFTVVLLKRMSTDSLKAILADTKILKACRVSRNNCTQPAWITWPNILYLAIPNSKADMTISTMLHDASTRCTAHWRDAAPKGGIQNGVDLLCVNVERSLFLYEYIEM